MRIYSHLFIQESYMVTQMLEDQSRIYSIYYVYMCVFLFSFCIKDYPVLLQKIQLLLSNTASESFRIIADVMCSQTPMYIGKLDSQLVISILTHSRL